jgi:polyisoprenoid-binding protein YceI
MTRDVGGGAGTMTGDLTLRGVTLPVTLKVAFVGVSRGFPFGTVAGFSASGTLRRSDFGSRSLLSYVGDDISLEIEAEFDRK